MCRLHKIFLDGRYIKACQASSVNSKELRKKTRAAVEYRTVKLSFPLSSLKAKTKLKRSALARA